MELFIKTSIALSFIGLFARFAHLLWGDYPYKLEYSRGEHGLMIVIGVLWCAWGWSVLP